MLRLIKALAVKCETEADFKAGVHQLELELNSAVGIAAAVGQITDQQLAVILRKPDYET